MKTICKCCDKVLTDESGRKHSAIFSSSTPDAHKKNTDTITYAFCEKCYRFVKGLDTKSKK